MSDKVVPYRFRDPERHSEFMGKIRYEENSSFQEFVGLCVKAYLSENLTLEDLKDLQEEKSE